MTTDSAMVKDEARRIVEQLPDDATWDDVLYEIYVAQAVKAGLEDCAKGRTMPISKVRERLGLVP